MTEQLQRSTLGKTRAVRRLACIFAPFMPDLSALWLRLDDRDLTKCCKRLHTVAPDHTVVVLPFNGGVRPCLLALEMLPGWRACPSRRSRERSPSRRTSPRTPWPRSWTLLAGWATARTWRHGV